MRVVQVFTICFAMTNVAADEIGVFRFLNEAEWQQDDYVGNEKLYSTELHLRDGQQGNVNFDTTKVKIRLPKDWLGNEVRFQSGHGFQHLNNQGDDNTFLSSKNLYEDRRLWEEEGYWYFYIQNMAAYNQSVSFKIFKTPDLTSEHAKSVQVRWNKVGLFKFLDDEEFKEKAKQGEREVQPPDDGEIEVDPEWTVAMIWIPKPWRGVHFESEDGFENVDDAKADGTGNNAFVTHTRDVDFHEDRKPRSLKEYWPTWKYVYIQKNTPWKDGTFRLVHPQYGRPAVVKWNKKQ